MRKLLLVLPALMLAGSIFAQGTKKNGTIFINHPSIDMINNSAKYYLARDAKSLAALYADTAKFWASGMQKQMPMAAALKNFDSDFDKYDDIKLIPQGYPDYLAYDKDHEKVVQSWWVWSGKSKKSGQVVTVYFVQFDDFNDAGKIRDESLFGDFSKME